MNREGPISWMTKNRVAANLMMMIFIIGGLLVSNQLKQEIFPPFDLDLIRITVPYPGSAPEEVEQGVILAIEDEVRGLDGVKKVKSDAVEDKGTVTVELLSGVDSSVVLQDVKNVVDSIQSLPEDAERPIVTLVEARNQVVSLIIYGDLDQRTLRNLAEKIRDDLIQLKEITLVEMPNVSSMEISIEVPQRNLRSYNLTLDKIADLIRRTALELPGGRVETPGGEVLLRTKERRDFAYQFADIPVVSNPDGSKVLLGEIAELNEGFEDSDIQAFFNGKPAIRIDVFRVGDQTPIEVSEIVHKYLKNVRKTLPEEVKITTWNDRSEFYKERIHLLLKNALIGLTLVLILLGVFLEPRLAFWVTIGIPTSILGSFLFIPFTGASINMVSLFAFIVTLGIIVDDAVVVGEIIYQKRELGISFLQASIEGTREICTPVTFAVLTNIAAFMPLFFVPGITGKIFLQIPAIVVSVFIVSLIESLFVLPAHLTHEHKKSKFWDTLTIPSIRVEKLLHKFINNVYVNHLKIATKNRYITLSIGIAILIISVSFVVSGYLEFSYLPRVDSDLVTTQAILPFGIPFERTQEVQKQIEKGAKDVLKEQEEGNISKGIYSQIGTLMPDTGGPARDKGAISSGNHLVGTQVFLFPSNKRSISGIDFAKKWKEKIGDISGIESITYNATIGTTGGAPIHIELSYPDTEILESAAVELATHLESYTGVSEIDDGVNLGKEQLSFHIKPEARSLGITVRDLARQVRSAFFGSEALRQQRGRNEIRVYVRLPAEETENIYTVEELMIRTEDGQEIPLSEAATIKRGRSYTSIKRTDGRRVLAVTADVDEKIANANTIISDILENFMPKLIYKYPGINFSLEGQQREQQESLDALKIGFAFAMLAIYTLLAIPFKSYIQPLIVMLSIPFGVVGAILGHLLLGYELSIMSMFGMIALAGVVVNDSLVMVVTTNRLREKGLDPYSAILKAAPLRFRPIILTSLTTFFGLAPMIFEPSVQARFLIPMAISLGFGILFSTFIILLILPCTYLIIEDLHQ